MNKEEKTLQNIVAYISKLESELKEYSLITKKPCKAFIGELEGKISASYYILRIVKETLE